MDLAPSLHAMREGATLAGVPVDAASLVVGVGLLAAAVAWDVRRHLRRRRA